MWLKDMQDYLAGGGHGETGKSLFIGRIPDEPGIIDQTVPLLSLMIAPGNTYYTMNGKGAAVRAPMVELSVRHANYLTAWDAIEPAWQALGAIGDQIIGGTHFMAVLPMGDIEDMERDDEGRQEFTGRFAVWFQDVEDEG